MVTNTILVYALDAQTDDPWISVGLAQVATIQPMEEMRGTRYHEGYVPLVVTLQGEEGRFLVDEDGQNPWMNAEDRSGHLTVAVIRAQLKGVESV